MNGWRWLVALGWGIPALVAAAIVLARRVPGGPSWLPSGPAVLVLVAPVLPLALVMLAVAAAAGRRLRRRAGHASARGDALFLGAAVAGVAVGVVLVAVAAALYFT
jgi:hypothetical protein